MLNSGEANYIVPRGDGVGDPIILDISAVIRAESRLRDVATVNKHNAAELLAIYNEHWLTLHRNVSLLTYERNKADEASKRAYAEAILDCTEDAVKRRGHLKTSQDLRDALATINADVVAARDRLNEIKAVLDYLVGKRQAFENAYNAVKKLVSNNELPPERLNYGNQETKQPPPLVDKFGDDDVDFKAGEAVSSNVANGFDEPSYGRR